MNTNRIRSVALAAAFAAALAPIASARDGSHYHGGHYRHAHADLKQLSERTLGGASRIVSGNRQRGSIARPGAYITGSTFFYSGGYRAIFISQPNGRMEQPYLAPKAKIIDVTEDAVDSSFRPINGCSYENGVCVIRGN